MIRLQYNEAMRIAFIGLKNCFDYYHIGGFSSYIRRLSTELASHGIEVHYIIYGAEKREEIKVNPNIKLRYFCTYEEAFRSILTSYSHIIPIWLSRYDRLKYLFSCKKISKSTKRHYLFLFWPDSIFKRNFKLIEAKFASYNGKVICVSKRQYWVVKKWFKNAVYILPPVPESYFLTPGEKPKNQKIKLTFLGKLSSDKGIEEVVELFKQLENNPRFEFAIYGIYDSKNELSLKISNWLKKQNIIKYIVLDPQRHSSKIEDTVENALEETDIFVQPYRTLIGTLDTPLLLLEAMASLCTVITTPLGSIPEIYGKSEFLIGSKNFVPQAVNFIKNISLEKIIKERERIYKQNKALNFKMKEVAKKFIEVIENI